MLALLTSRQRSRAGTLTSNARATGGGKPPRIRLSLWNACLRMCIRSTSASIPVAKTLEESHTTAATEKTPVVTAMPRFEGIHGSLLAARTARAVATTAVEPTRIALGGAQANTPQLRAQNAGSRSTASSLGGGRICRSERSSRCRCLQKLRAVAAWHWRPHGQAHATKRAIMQRLTRPCIRGLSVPAGRRGGAGRKGCWLGWSAASRATATPNGQLGPFESQARRPAGEAVRPSWLGALLAGRASTAPW